MCCNIQLIGKFIESHYYLLFCKFQPTSLTSVTMVKDQDLDFVYYDDNGIRNYFMVACFIKNVYWQLQKICTNQAKVLQSYSGFDIPSPAPQFNRQF